MDLDLFEDDDDDLFATIQIETPQPFLEYTDLFEDDGDDLFSTIQLETPQPFVEYTEVFEKFPEFDCSGEDHKNAKFSKRSFLRSNFINKCDFKDNEAVSDFKSTEFQFHNNKLNSHSVFRFVYGEVCKNIQHLLNDVLSPNGVYDGISHYQQRREVTRFYYFVLYNTETKTWPLIRDDFHNLHNLLNQISDKETWKIISFAHSNKGNDCNVPAYHLLHGILEWKLLDIFILSKFEMGIKYQQNSVQANNYNRIRSHILRLFHDLMTCSVLLFMKMNSSDLLTHSAFPCTCIKEAWLILQLSTITWNEQDEIKDNENSFCFWSLYTHSLTNIKDEIATYAITQLAFCEFAIWLSSALLSLCEYQSDSQHENLKFNCVDTDLQKVNPFIHDCVQQFLEAEPNEEHLRIFICILTSMILKTKHSNINVPMILWEYFYKKLNTVFYKTGAAPNNLAVACSTGRTYIEKYRSLLKNEEPDLNLTSYTQFTLLLGKTVSSLLKSHQHHQAQKLLGRIYSKFSLQKFLALNEAGIHHTIELFLILGLSGNFTDLAIQLREKLLSISLEKITANKQVAVTKGHMALLILHAEQQLDISEYVNKLLQQIAAVRNNLSVCKVVADSLLDIFQNFLQFGNGEHLLIDSWLPHYLDKCPPVEQDRSLEALLFIFGKLENSGFKKDFHRKILTALETHILPYVKKQYACNYSHYLPQLAAEFCIHMSDSGNEQTFQRLFIYFVSTQTASRHSLPQFLLKILESCKATLVDEKVIMHVWLKSLVLLTAFNAYVVKLTEKVAQLSEFKFMTGLLPMDFLTSTEPLGLFVASLGKQYDQCENYQNRCRIADNLNAFLKNFEKWLNTDLRHEKYELTVRFYSFIAIVIYNCPNIVYVKSKITCFFHIAMTRFILPTSIQMEVPPDMKLSQIIHKIWPVIVQGIGKMNFKTDSYINKTLNDLIQKWTPHFKISSNTKTVAKPFITCLQSENQELALFVFEKLTNTFLTVHHRKANINACLVVTIYQEIVDELTKAENSEISKNVHHLVIFMKGTCVQSLEHIMMVDELVPSHVMLLNFFKSFISSRLFQASKDLQNSLEDCLRIITKKHLAYCTFFFFDLLMKLTQISYMPVLRIMDFLVNEVHVVEAKRGAGEDIRIRSSLLELQETVENAKKTNYS